MSENETKKRIIEEYAEEEWLEDPEGIVVYECEGAEAVASKLEAIRKMGIDTETKVSVIFPEGYTPDDLAEGKPQPEGEKWYVIYHKEKSKFMIRFEER